MIRFIVRLAGALAIASLSFQPALARSRPRCRKRTSSSLLRTSRIAPSDESFRSLRILRVCFEMAMPLGSDVLAE